MAEKDAVNQTEKPWVVLSKKQAELDFAVAKAIELESAEIVEHKNGSQTCMISQKDMDVASGLVSSPLWDQITVPFHPSVFSNDAFWAAERLAKSGIIVHRPPEEECDEEERWECVLGLPDSPWNDPRVQRQATIAWDVTPAMAICKAIIKLKEPNESRQTRTQS